MNQPTKELREAAARASAGPWYEEDTEDASGLQVLSGTGNVVCALPHDFVNLTGNAAYIAAASPDVVLRLIAVCDAAQRLHELRRAWASDEYRAAHAVLAAALDDLGPIQP